MKDWVQRKLNDVISDDVQAKMKEKMAESGVTVPISASMLMRIFQKQMTKQDQIQQFSISFQDSYIHVNGIIKKFLVRIPFSIVLEPLEAKERTLLFKIHEMKPLNQNWINYRIFHKPPVTTYEEKQIHINLNEIDKIKVIPLGKIKQFSIQDEKLRVKIGL
ncbi:hypothetical protein GFV16_07825 [Bacillus megaterium]|uniref:hypothetical protein n=1 Tax=Priestia megaterium TaxID=1404 RepID=UPI001293B822|nr:hypothetical protein [Priestia megaterium]MQR85824.1 hypothetical protein [Priestia megaterium]